MLGPLGLGLMALKLEAPKGPIVHEKEHEREGNKHGFGQKAQGETDKT
jgi:hypothetical protein